MTSYVHGPPKAILSLHRKDLPKEIKGKVVPLTMILRSAPIPVIVELLIDAQTVFSLSVARDVMSGL